MKGEKSLMEYVASYLKVKSKNICHIFLILFVSSSCNPISQNKELDSRIGENGPDAQNALPPGIWDFTTAGNYTYNTDYISITAGKATLLTVDQTDNEASDFASGTHLGTEYSGSALTLGSAGGCDATATNCAELDESWTPQYSSLIGYWKLNNNFLDSSSSVNTHDASFTVGTTDFLPNERIGSHGINFGGEADGHVLSVPDHADLDAMSSFSFSFWVRFNDPDV